MIINEEDLAEEAYDENLYSEMIDLDNKDKILTDEEVAKLYNIPLKIRIKLPPVPIDINKKVDIPDILKYERRLPRRTEYQGACITLDSIEDQIEKYSQLADEREPSKSLGIRKPQGTKCSYDGEQFDSIWEVAFYRYMKELKGNNVERNHMQSIPYTDESGKLRKFYPDFKVNGQWCEVKGIWRPSDIAKRDACPEVTFYSKTELKPMIAELNKRIPRWRDDIIKR